MGKQEKAGYDVGIVRGKVVLWIVDCNAWILSMMDFMQGIDLTGLNFSDHFVSNRFYEENRATARQLWH